MFLLFKEFYGRGGSEGGHKVRITKLSGKGNSSPQGPVCLITEERVKYVHIFIRIRNYHFLNVCLMERFWDFFFFHLFRHTGIVFMYFLCLDFFSSMEKVVKESSL